MRQFILELPNRDVDNYNSKELQNIIKDTIHGPFVAELYRQYLNSNDLHENQEKSEIRNAIRYISSMRWERKFQVQLMRGKENRILFVGHSIALPEQNFKGILDSLQSLWPILPSVIAHSFMEDTFAINRIREEVEQYKIDYVLLFDFPDLIKKQAYHLEGLLEEEKKIDYARNLLDWVEGYINEHYRRLFEKASSTRFIVCSMYSVDVEVIIRTISTSKTIETIIKQNQELIEKQLVRFNESLEQLCAEYEQVQYLDLYSPRFQGQWIDLWTPDDKLSADLVEHLIKVLGDLPPKVHLTT